MAFDGNDFDGTGKTILDALIRARKAKGWSIEEAAAKTGLSARHLKKLEEGNLTFLPPAYIVTILKTYASGLGTYDEPLFDILKRKAGLPILKKTTPEKTKTNRKGFLPFTSRHIQAAATGLLVVIALGWLFFHSFHQNINKESFPVATTPTPRGNHAANDQISKDPPPIIHNSIATKPITDTVVTSAKSRQKEVSTTLARGCFTTRINTPKKEPVDKLAALRPSAKTLYYFTDIKNPSGEPIYHEWLYNDNPVSKTPVGKPKGNRWRCWSQKNIANKTQGIWKVRVIQGRKTILHTDSIAVMPDH